MSDMMMTDMSDVMMTDMMVSDMMMSDMTVSNMMSDMMSDIMSDMTLSDMLSDTMSDTVSDMMSDMMMSDTTLLTHISLCLSSSSIFSRCLLPSSSPCTSFATGMSSRTVRRVFRLRPKWSTSANGKRTGGGQRARARPQSR